MNRRYATRSAMIAAGIFLGYQTMDTYLIFISALIGNMLAVAFLVSIFPREGKLINGNRAILHCLYGIVTLFVVGISVQVYLDGHAQISNDLLIGLTLSNFAPFLAKYREQ